MSNSEHFHQQASRLPLLTPAQELALGYKAQAGDRTAINTLVKHNIRLVYRTADWYQRRNTMIDRDDLIMAGIEGIYRAAEKYDPRKGYRFSTYATQWVRQSIVRYVEANHSRVMRVPNHVVASYTNDRMTEPQREHYAAQHVKTLSIDATLSNSDENLTIRDTIQDPGPNPEQATLETETENHHHHQLLRAFDHAQLTLLERRLLEEHHGILGSPTYTPDEIADRRNLTPKEITDTINRIHERLRQHL